MNLDLEHFAARILQDAFTSGLQSFWLRRSMDFLSARSRPGDFLGRDSTPAAIRLMDERLTGLANACRARAALAPLQDAEIDDALAQAVLDEVAS